MSDTVILPSDARQFTLLVCAVVALLLLGAAGGLVFEDTGVDRGSSTPQDDGDVAITSPAENETFAHADILRIDLAFENADTAILTMENRTTRRLEVTEASPPSVSIDSEAEDGKLTLRAETAGGAIDRFGWDMGDGTSLSGETVTHTYDEPGEYTLELLVTGPGGTDTDSVTVTVEESSYVADSESSDLSVTIDEGAGDDTSSDDGLGAGFGVFVAVAAAAICAILLLQRR